MAALGIVLATYNEAGNLQRLVEGLEGLGEDIHIYVVDDSSPDGTAALAQELAGRYRNISLITRPAKGGLGSALRAGMRAALEDGHSLVLTMDADLSHDPKDVPRLRQDMSSGEADMAQGSRYAKGGGTEGYRWTRRLASRAANLAYHYMLGTPTEATNSFRAYTRNSARIVADRCVSNGFAFQPEATLTLMNHSLKITEVPITFTSRAAGKSKLGVLQAVHGLLFFLFALITFRLKLGRFARSGRPTHAPLP